MTQRYSHTIAYISHGGGPLPILGDPGHAEMVENLKELSTIIPCPSAIVLISAHWEEPQPTVTRGTNPPLYFDYYGFPQESYELEYPAPGHRELEHDIHTALDRSGFACASNGERGFDHGMFIPLMIMYPEAEVPCIQLSLIRGLNPVEHIRMGQALSELAYDNLLILGSGFSFHNMRVFFTPDTEETRTQNIAFDDWLVETCSDTTLSEAERTRRLEKWENAPHARYCHPREEHLLPLHVCYGAVGRPCDSVFKLNIIQKRASAFLWKASR